MFVFLVISVAELFEKKERRKIGREWLRQWKNGTSKCLSSPVRISRLLLSPPSVAPLMYVSLSFEVSVKKGFFFFFWGFGVGFCGFCVFGLMGLFGLVRFQLGLLRISECNVFWVKTQKGAFFFLPVGLEFCGVLCFGG